MENLQLTTHNSQRGIASLPLILLLGAIIIEVSIASVFFLSYLNTSVYGTRMASEALIAAQAGINDGLLRVVTNNAADDLTYSMSIGNATADVSICKGGNVACPAILIGQHQITSVGKALTRQHRLVAVLSVDVYGLVYIESIKEQ